MLFQPELELGGLERCGALSCIVGRWVSHPSSSSPLGAGMRNTSDHHRRPGGENPAPFGTRVRWLQKKLRAGGRLMEQRLSLVTLGVRDVSRARAFYEALGWRLDGGVDDETDHVAFFQAGGLIVALWDRGKLERDSGVEDRGGWGGVTLAHNVRSPAEVDAVLAEAREAGATIARSGAATFWGGYSGVFLDPD